MCILLLCVLVGATLGLVSGVDDGIHATDLHAEINLSEVYSLDPFQRAMHLAANNLRVSLLCFVGGALSMGFMPPLLMFYNGFVLGNVAGRSSYILSVGEIIGATAPHCFEFIGIAMFGLAGFRLCRDVFWKRKYSELSKIMCFLALSAAVVVLAAFVESYISMSV